MLPTERINEIITYWLARAKCRYGRGLHIYGYLFLSNHFHLFCKDTEGTLAQFMGYFEGNGYKPRTWKRPCTLLARTLRRPDHRGRKNFLEQVRVHHDKRGKIWTRQTGRGLGGCQLFQSCHNRRDHQRSIRGASAEQAGIEPGITTQTGETKSVPSPISWRPTNST